MLHYLKGLHYEFEPAIQYVNTLLDTWAQDGINPKCNIRSLPQTIDNFITRSTGNGHQSAVIRTLQDKPSNHADDVLQQLCDDIDALKQAATSAEPSTAIVNYVQAAKKSKPFVPWKPNQKESTSTPDLNPAVSRKSADVFCEGCGGCGHPWAACDFAAKLIKALDYIATLDPTNRKIVLENYHKEQFIAASGNKWLLLVVLISSGTVVIVKAFFNWYKMYSPTLITSLWTHPLLNTISWTMMNDASQGLWPFSTVDPILLQIGLSQM